jgi:hypothetical protein
MRERSFAERTRLNQMLSLTEGAKKNKTKARYDRITSATQEPALAGQITVPVFPDERKRRSRLCQNVTRQTEDCANELSPPLLGDHR